MTNILPDNLDQQIKNAVKQFWELRLDKNKVSQEAGRGAVISGKNMDGFTTIIKNIAEHCGLPADSVTIDGKNKLTIPGYFRPTKMWDSLVIYKGRLIAAFELKSQVGSFGNNFNNRTEESIGSAKDFWTAHRENAFSIENYIDNISINTSKNRNLKPPFLAYLMLLESCQASISPVKVGEKHFKVFPEFQSSSYAKRYQILCERLILEGLYSSTCLILSDIEEGYRSGAYSSPSESLKPRNMFAEFAGRLLAAKTIFGNEE